MTQRSATRTGTSGSESSSRAGRASRRRARSGTTACTAAACTPGTPCATRRSRPRSSSSTPALYSDGQRGGRLGSSRRPAGPRRRNAARGDPAVSARRARRDRRHRRRRPPRPQHLPHHQGLPARRSPAASRERCRCRPTCSPPPGSRSTSSRGRPSGAAGVRSDAGCRRARGPGAEHRRPRRAALPRDPGLELRGCGKFAEFDATVRFDVVEAPDYRGEALHLAPRPETALVVWLHSTMKVVWDVEPDYVPNPTDDVWHCAGDGRARARRSPARSESAAPRHDRRYLGDRMRPAELMPLLFDAEQFPAQRQPAQRRADPCALLRPAGGPQEP